MADLTRKLKEQGVDIRNFFTWPEKDCPDVFQLVTRVDAEDGHCTIDVLTAHGSIVMTG